MSALIRLCAAVEVLEGKPLRVEREGHPPLVAFRVSDGYYLTIDKCTHGMGVLSEGLQTGSLIECPLHRGVFDIRSGQAVRFPCRIALQILEPVLVDGWLCVDQDALP